jgi:uncharacterized GH25 family protein/uncharacterized protein (DUF2141 family)
MHRQVCVLLALCFAAFPAVAAITGVVMTTDGQPVAGARVWVRPIETTEQRTARLQSASPELVPLAAVQTDAKGTFTIESPKAPVVDLAISAAGYEPTQRRVERDEEVGAIALARSETRTATVTANGKPVPNAWVVLSINGFEHVVKTDEQGRYQSPDPKRLRSYLVMHPDYAVVQGVPVSQTIAASDLNYKLTAGTKLTGKVVGADDKPVAGATLMIDNWPVATSAEDGSFTIAHAPARWTTLIAKKDSLLAHRAFSKDTAYTLKLAKGATVSGRLTDAKSKMPIAGALVTFGPGNMRMSRGSGYAVLTDAKGMFSAVVPAGSYMLWSSHPGFIGAPAELSVTAGQSLSKDIAVNPVARISGVVTDESKNPVVAASVSPESPEQPFMGGMRMLTDTSTISGPDGRFTVRVELDREVVLRAAKKGLPSARTETLRVSAGERKTGVSIVIPTGYAVSGRVTDAQGNPLSGVAVTAAETEPGRGGMVTRMIMLGSVSRDDDAVRTSSDGTFTLRVKEGTYDFSFRREGFAPKLISAQTVTATSSPSIEAALDPAVEITGRVTRGGVGIENVMIFAIGASESRAVTGPDGSFTVPGLAAGAARLMIRKEDEFISEQRSIEAPARDVVIEVRAGGRVSGRVVEKNSSKPVTSFQAGLSTSRGGGGGGMMMGPPQLRDFTSDDGSFVLENVPAGAMTLVVNAPGYASGRLNITVEEGKTVSDIEVPLDPGVKLVGRVTGSSGQPLSDVSVSIAPSPTGNFATSGMRRSTVTDNNGEYVLDSLEAGEEAIQFSHPKHTAQRKNVTLKGRETRLDMQLTSGAKLTGTVVTEAGVPVPDANVELRGASYSRARTNQNGTFEFESVNPGRYTIAASKTGFAEGKIDDYDATGGTPARVVLRAGGTIYGRVTGLTPQELTTVEVETFGRGGNASATVDAQGNYRLEGAPAGSLRVQARVMSRAIFESKTSRTYTVEMTPGGSQQVDIEFRGDVTLRGRVTKNGVPLRGGNVAFYPKGGDSRSSGGAAIDEQGNYTITSLEDGEYDVTVNDLVRGTPHRLTYTVRGSGTFDIDYRTGLVRGRVLDVANNEPLSNATVQLRPSTTEFRGMFGGATDTNGTFVIDSVPPGTYVVTASKDGYGNQVMDLVVGDSSVDNVELRMARNDGVTLKIVDARDGRQVSAMVTVFDMQGRVVHESRMMYFAGGADTSEARLPVSPGAYTASVSAMNYAPRNISFQSPSTQTVAMTPGGTLHIASKHSSMRRVRLIDASGLVYPRSSWSMQGRELLPSPGTTTYANVAPGTYTLQLLDDNNNVVDSRQVVVAEGQTSNAEI